MPSAPRNSRAPSVAERASDNTDLPLSSGFAASSKEHELETVVAGVRANNAAAIVRLYGAFSWVKARFAAKLNPQDAEDRYHDLILATIMAIKKGELRDQTRLAGYVTGIARNMLTDSHRALQRARTDETHESWFRIPDRSPSAERLALDKELRAIASRVLNTMSARDRGVLMRFYVHEEDPRRICTEMGLTETQFRLTKSRAKARFADLLRQRIKPKSVVVERRSAITA